MLNNGDVFAGFTIERLLGQGGMGSVYLARHPRLGKLTALKLLNRELFADREIRARFEREADLVAQLDHPNIVEVYDRGTEDEQLWISMQFIDGVDAAGVNVTLLPPERAVQIIEGVAAALDYAHTMGVLHRDVKPANIILARAVAGHGERVFLTDFGIARLREDSTHLTQAGMFTATLAYASPEQMTGAPLDHTTDQYSLACALYWLLIGAGPYDSPHPAELIRGHLQLLPPPVSLRRPGLTQAMDAVLTKAMAKRPTDRFPSCTDFAKAARRALTAPAYTNQPAPHPASPPGYAVAPPTYAAPPAGAYPAPPQPYPAPPYAPPAQPYPADPSAYPPPQQPAPASGYAAPPQPAPAQGYPAEPAGYPAEQRPAPAPGYSAEPSAYPAPQPPQPQGYSTPPPQPNAPAPQLVTPLPPASPAAPAGPDARPADLAHRPTDSFPTSRPAPETSPPGQQAVEISSAAPDSESEQRPEAFAGPSGTASSESPASSSPSPIDPSARLTDSFPTRRVPPEASPCAAAAVQQAAEMSSAAPDSRPEQLPEPLEGSQGTATAGPSIGGPPSSGDLSSQPTDSFPTRREPPASGSAAPETPAGENSPVSSQARAAQPLASAGSPETVEQGPSTSSDERGADSARHAVGSAQVEPVPGSESVEHAGGADASDGQQDSGSAGRVESAGDAGAVVSGADRSGDSTGYPGAGLRHPESGAFVPSEGDAGFEAPAQRGDADSVWSRAGAEQTGSEVGPVGSVPPQFGPPPGYPMNSAPPQQVPEGRRVERSQVTALVVLGLAVLALLLMLAVVVVQVAG